MDEGPLEASSVFPGGLLDRFRLFVIRLIRLIDGSFLVSFAGDSTVAEGSALLVSTDAWLRGGSTGGLVGGVAGVMLIR